MPERSASKKSIIDPISRWHQSENELYALAPFSAFLCRLIWSLAGPGLLCMWALKMAILRDGWIAPTDIGFLFVLAAMLISRWIDFRIGDLAVAMQATTFEQFHRYTEFWLAWGGVTWISANLIGNRILY